MNSTQIDIQDLIIELEERAKHCRALAESYKEVRNKAICEGKAQAYSHTIDLLKELLP